MLIGSNAVLLSVVKIVLFMPENASFQRYFNEVNFDTSEGNQLSFQRGNFQKFFGDFMNHIPYFLI